MINKKLNKDTGTLYDGLQGVVRKKKKYEQ